MHWHCYCPYSICLEGFLGTFIYTHRHRYINRGKFLRPPLKVCFCIVVKHGPCQQEICLRLKLVTIEWFDGYVVKDKIAGLYCGASWSAVCRMYADWIYFDCLVYQQEETSWTKKIINFIVNGPTSWGRPKLRWKDVVNSDLYKKCFSLASETGMKKCHQTNDGGHWTATHSELNTEMKRPVSKFLTISAQSLKNTIEVAPT